jgi:hypothetical protein
MEGTETNEGRGDGRIWGTGTNETKKRNCGRKERVQGRTDRMKEGRKEGRKEMGWWIGRIVQS